MNPIDVPRFILAFDRDMSTMTVRAVTSSPACGGGSRWGLTVIQKAPHPNLPPHAGEGAKRCV